MHDSLIAAPLCIILLNYVLYNEFLGALEFSVQLRRARAGEHVRDFFYSFGIDTFFFFLFFSFYNFLSSSLTSREPRLLHRPTNRDPDEYISAHRRKLNNGRPQ